jgi:ATP-dependent DNA helicase RecQ
MVEKVIALGHYSYKDVEKLEKFMSGKPVAEQERICFVAGSGGLCQSDVQKILLHYF